MLWYSSLNCVRARASSLYFLPFSSKCFLFRFSKTSYFSFLNSLPFFPRLCNTFSQVFVFSHFRHRNVPSTPSFLPSFHLLFFLVSCGFLALFNLLIISFFADSFAPLSSFFTQIKSFLNQNVIKIPSLPCFLLSFLPEFSPVSHSKSLHLLLSAWKKKNRLIK